MMTPLAYGSLFRVKIGRQTAAVNPFPHSLNNFPVLKFNRLVPVHQLFDDNLLRHINVIANAENGLPYFRYHAGQPGFSGLIQNPRTFRRRGHMAFHTVRRCLLAAFHQKRMAAGTPLILLDCLMAANAALLGAQLMHGLFEHDMVSFFFAFQAVAADT
jgi:hypothetical protein